MELEIRVAHKMHMNTKGFRCLQSIQNDHESAEMAQGKTPQNGLREGWTRATFILRKDYLERLKRVAYWERKKIKEVIDEALRLYFKGEKTRTRRNR